LSEVEIGRLAAYDGPTWLDEAIVGKLQVQKELPGFPAELRQAPRRPRPLAGSAEAGRCVRLERGGAEAAHDAQPETARDRAPGRDAVARQLNAIHVPHEPGSRISGVYEHAIATPTGKLAVIRSADTFTLALCKPAVEPLRGRAVLGLVGPNRVMWTLERGRTLPGRG
jgi:hypothetical protein